VLLGRRVPGGAQVYAAYGQLRELGMVGGSCDSAYRIEALQFTDLCAEQVSAAPPPPPPRTPRPVHAHKLWTPRASRGEGEEGRGGGG
jgi:hypothetical protein